MHTLLLLDEFREGISMIFVGNVSGDGVNENYLLAKEILLSIGVSFNIVFSFKNMYRNLKIPKGSVRSRNSRR